jgi:hypothetical protein
MLVNNLNYILGGGERGSLIAEVKFRIYRANVYNCRQSLGGLQLDANLAKIKLARSPSQSIRDMEVHTCDPSYARGYR